ncbi:uncharacterized protein MAM_00885 [Metarhizium album ARSEF 1941]|uniref:Uncharacterized protein n=1 Tax=Metarhizium album (strain ARSEF 1941) TaxID=1081103 RepID=A0A0B2X673_METAS|nr:uncharacterized protein MAM_00885 [Metarhizium album ARSEF 1941]KHO01884.1 hypothetical protein MAM_00885 [Metarhizium album ARSEF 1941]
MRLFEALARLVENQERLDRAGRSFHQSPKTESSSKRTKPRCATPDLPSEEQRRKDRGREMRRDYHRSYPYRQFKDQLVEEQRRITAARFRETRGDVSGALGSLASNQNDYRLAEETVMECWAKQGIWNDKRQPKGRSWRRRHEEPLALDADDKRDSESYSLFHL